MKITPETRERARLFEAVARLRVDSDRRDFDPVIASLAATDRRSVEEILGSIPDPELCGYLLNRLAIRWAEDNPVMTAAWMRMLPSQVERTQALLSVHRIWGEKDPAAAAASAAGIPAGKLRQQALGAVLSEWVRCDMEGATAWMVQARPGPDLDAAAAEVARMPEVIAGDPAAALGWAESISDVNRRAETLGLVLRAWADRDRAAAVQYARTTPTLTPDQRVALIETLHFDH